jgi:hypothetical protein
MKSIFFLFVIIYSGTVFSFPIEPASLRKLVMTSEYIVIGYVRTFSDDENNFYSHDKALIEIREVLQGKLEEKFVTLKMDIDLICPAPARYFDSTYTIAFLKRNSKGELYTNCLSYGSKTLSLPEIEIYKSRIKELQNILLISDSMECEKQTIEWLVKCAEDPVTRWEGLYELSPQYIEMSYSRYLYIQPKFQLNDFQKENLWKSLSSIDSVNFSDLGLIDIFLLSESVKVKEWLIQKINDKKFSDNFIFELLNEKLVFLKNEKKQLVKH